MRPRSQNQPQVNGRCRVPEHVDVEQHNKTCAPDSLTTHAQDYRASLETHSVNNNISQNYIRIDVTLLNNFGPYHFQFYSTNVCNNHKTVLNLPQFSF